MEDPTGDVALGLQEGGSIAIPGQMLIQNVVTMQETDKDHASEPPPPSPSTGIRHASRGSLNKSVKASDDKNSEFEAVFLREKFSSELLTRYYRELLIPNIPFEDERDPIEKIERGLKRPSEELRSDNVLPYVNVCLLLHMPKNGEKHEGDGTEEREKADLVGAVQFEYYCTANCGLITYLLTNERYRGRGIAKTLVFYAQGKLEVIAKFFGHLAGMHKRRKKYSLSLFLSLSLTQILDKISGSHRLSPFPHTLLLRM